MWSCKYPRPQANRSSREVRGGDGPRTLPAGFRPAQGPAGRERCAGPQVARGPETRGLARPGIRAGPSEARRPPPAQPKRTAAGDSPTWAPRPAPPAARGSRARGEPGPCRRVAHVSNWRLRWARGPHLAPVGTSGGAQARPRPPHRARGLLLEFGDCDGTGAGRVLLLFFLFPFVLSSIASVSLFSLLLSPSPPVLYM